MVSKWKACLWQTDRKQVVVVVASHPLGIYKNIIIKMSVESQKGVIIIQRCSVENQKGAIIIQSLNYSNNTLLVLNKTSSNSIYALLVLSQRYITWGYLNIINNYQFGRLCCFCFLTQVPNELLQGVEDVNVVYFGKRKQVAYRLNLGYWRFHILPSVLFFQIKFYA